MPVLLLLLLPFRLRLRPRLRLPLPFMLSFWFCVAATPGLLALLPLSLAEMAATDAPILRESNNAR